MVNTQQQENLLVVSPNSMVQGPQKNYQPTALLEPHLLPSVSLSGPSLKTSSEVNLKIVFLYQFSLEHPVCKKLNMPFIAYTDDRVLVTNSVFNYKKQKYIPTLCFMFNMEKVL